MRISILNSWHFHINYITSFFLLLLAKRSSTPNSFANLFQVFGWLAACPGTHFNLRCWLKLMMSNSGVAWLAVVLCSRDRESRRRADAQVKLKVDEKTQNKNVYCKWTSSPLVRFCCCCLLLWVALPGRSSGLFDCWLAGRTVCRRVLPPMLLYTYSCCLVSFTIN